MSMIYFAGAVLFVWIAHLIRIFRWELFIEVYEKANRRKLMQAIACGYLLNYFLPCKLGEIVRAWWSGRSLKNGMALGFSTVIIERYLDVVFVGAMFILIVLCGGNAYSKIALVYVEASILLLVLALLGYMMRHLVKRAVKAVAGMFNETIESAFLQFAWGLIWNFKNIFQKISKVRLILTTVCMWTGYLISYILWAAFWRSQGTNVSWTDIFFILFTYNKLPYANAVMVYMLLPSLFLLLLSYVFRKEKQEDILEENYMRMFPHRDARERLNFLEMYFSGTNRTYVENYLKINQGVSIIRDYSAGSNATTMLCIDTENTFFRKYAFGEDGDKLYEQVLWLERYKDKIALPEILRKERTAVYCYYDMPYNSASVGLFEYVHSMPVERGWDMIRTVLEHLEQSVYKHDVRVADMNTIHNYIERKVRNNLDTIRSAKKIRNLQQYDMIYINGVAYPNLSAYEMYLSEDYLQKVFQQDMYMVIHGDLTIENIICTRDDKGRDDFYIIDPNTGNIHDSPNLDYGKLLQSIHGGYEFLMSAKNVKVVDNRIDFLFIKSSSYIELHKLLRSYMNQRFGFEKTKSIYFHEIIHWLRLMPYKIEKDGKRALLFYAGMLMVMRDVIEMYDNDEVEKDEERHGGEKELSTV